MFDATTTRPAPTSETSSATPATSEPAGSEVAFAGGRAAIPAAASASASAPPGAAAPTASELAFDGAPPKGLTPEQLSYYEQIRQRDPTIPEAKARDIASRSRPLSAADRNQVHAVQQQIATMKPRRIDDPKNPNLVQIEVAFDGSGDDREQMADDTNPARLDAAFDGRKHYESGIATEGKLKAFEMVTGAGIEAKIDAAYTNLVAQINAVKSENPRAQVVLVVTGFSRGAATARAFVNDLNRRGVPVLASQKPDGSFGAHYDTPRVGVMVLFDTVQMTVNRGLDLSIPKNVDNVLHLTARDEHRTTRPLSRATDPSRADDTRITEVALPGSHSDVGGGYANPYSRIPEQIARDYMVNAGVHMKPQDPSERVDVNDPSLRLHDSGSGLFGMKRPTFDSHNPK